MELIVLILPVSFLLVALSFFELIREKSPSKGRVAIKNPEACLEHRQRIVRSPNQALTLSTGHPEQDTVHPQMGPNFESIRPGCFYVGELVGLSQIHKAMRQSIQVAKHLSQYIQPKSDPYQLDVAIIGAGPSGMACASQLTASGYNIRVFETEFLGASIMRHPKDRIIMNGYVSLPRFGQFGGQELAKSEVSAQLEALRQKCHIPVLEYTTVDAITGSMGNFCLQTNQGNIHTQLVVIAVGLRGQAKRLGVPGENKSKVSYDIFNLKQYHGRRVLVIGDSHRALETALNLATTHHASVTLSCPQKFISNSRIAKQFAFTQAIDHGAILAVPDSTIQKIEDKFIELLSPQGMKVIGNDNVLICRGQPVSSDLSYSSEAPSLVQDLDLTQAAESFVPAKLSTSEPSIHAS